MCVSLLITSKISPSTPMTNVVRLTGRMNERRPWETPNARATEPSLSDSSESRSRAVRELPRRLLALGSERCAARGGGRARQSHRHLRLWFARGRRVVRHAADAATTFASSSG
jgi:hypothetical protein